MAAAIAPFHQQVAALAAQNAKLMEIVDGLRRDNELLRQLTQVTVSAAHEPSDDVSGNTRSTKRTRRVADAATSSSSPAGSPSLTQPQLEAIVRNTSHLIWSNQDKYHRSMTSSLESKTLGVLANQLSNVAGRRIEVTPHHPRQAGNGTSTCHTVLRCH